MGDSMRTFHSFYQYRIVSKLNEITASDWTASRCILWIYNSVALCLPVYICEHFEYHTIKHYYILEMVMCSSFTLVPIVGSAAMNLLLLATSLQRTATATTPPSKNSHHWGRPRETPCRISARTYWALNKLKFWSQDTRVQNITTL